MKLDVTKIDSVEFDGIDWKDYPDFCDAFVSSASWDDGKDLTEDELDVLNDEHRDFVYERLIKHLY